MPEGTERRGASESQPTVVYVAYWGLSEPLGEALILPTILRLRDSGWRVALLTFEKQADLRREGARLGTLLASKDILWRPLRYHKRPRVLAKLLDLAAGVWAALRIMRACGPLLIHARTYVGGLVGLLLKWLTNATLIFHNEGFWPDQQVEGGVWLSGSLAHRIAKRLERRMYEAADGLILLTEESRRHVVQLPGVAGRMQPTVIVPSCVDLDNFRCEGEPETNSSDSIRLVYLGSLGGRYLVAPIVRAFRTFRDQGELVSLTIISHTDHESVRIMLASAGLPSGEYELMRLSHDAVPGALCAASVGLFFLSDGVGALSCSPTKVGEYLACGLPVLLSSGLGELNDEIVRRRVGAVVEEVEGGSYDEPVSEITALLRDGELPERCRRTARELFGLEQSVRRQLELYGRLIPPRSSEH